MTFSRASLCIALALAVSSPVLAQDEEESPPPAFPETEIFLFDLDLSNAEDALSNGINATDRAGYDNQPFFTSSSQTFLYSRDDGVQTDIWEYDIPSATHRQVTDNADSEFSPTPSPDNRTISVVYELSNSIWDFDRSAPDAPQWVLESGPIPEPVGYFARNYATGDVIYWSRYGFNIALTHADRPAYHFVTGHAVPSTPHLIPGTGRFSFVHRQTNEQVWIKDVDPATRAVRPLTPIVGTNANYTWTPDGAILQIEDGKLYIWREDDGTGWQQISDLAAHGVTGAARISVSPNGAYVAIVGLPAE